MPITSGTVIGSGIQDDVSYNGIALPFTFIYGGQTMTHIAISTNGYARLATSSVDATSPGSVYKALFFSNTIAPFSYDLAGNLMGELSYITQGTTPNRTFVIQWKDYAIRSGMGNSSINFQIRLIESTNTIRFVYGIFSIIPPTADAQVGLRGIANIDFNNRATTTDWSSTTSGTTNAAFCSIISPNVFPSNGLTYTWIPPPLCTSTPTAGTTISSDGTSICTGYRTTLSLAGNSVNNGLTYQWQSSSTLTGSYTDIVGATGIIHTVTQTNASFYRCLVTCTSTSLSNTSVPVSIITELVGCYCPVTQYTGTMGEGCIINVTLGTMNNNSVCGSPNYIAYSPTITTNLIQGAVMPISVSINVSTGGTSPIAFVGVWIDFNANGFFETAELTRLGQLPPTFLINTGSITVPEDAVVGLTKMRIRSTSANAPGANTNSFPCGLDFYGETEDYFVNIVAGTPCAGTPILANTLASATTVCGGVSFGLSLGNTYVGTSGLRYQWQSATTLTGTYTSIVGAISSTYTTTQTTTNFYRCVVSCANSLASTISTPVLVGYTNCYCTPTGILGSVCITNVTFGTINNTSATCVAPFYTIFPATITTNLTQGTSVPITITVAIGNNAIVSVWIDFNANGLFEVSEWTQPYISATTGTVNITIPPNATVGTTKMRIRSRASGNINGAGNGCPTGGSGEVEDYFVNIVAGVACSGTPVANTAISSTASVCVGANFNLSLGILPTTANFTYQWQSSATLGGAYTNIAGATNIPYITSQTATTSYRCVVSCAASGSSSITTTPVTVVSSVTSYASVPYTQNFENTWLTSSCVVAPLGQDIPDASWTNIKTGRNPNTSWRADNTTTTLSGWVFLSGAYTPTGANGTTRSARFHNFVNNNLGFRAGETSSMDLYVNLAGGTKNLTFYYIHQTSVGSGLELLLSTNGGLTFTQISTPALVPASVAVPTWTQVSVNITGSATSVLRFRGTDGLNLNSGQSDIGLDEISITSLASCTVTFANTSANDAILGTPYTLNASATAAFGTFTYSVSPALPLGLSLNTTTGIISGTPVGIVLAPSTTYTVTARSGAACGAAQAYTFEVVCPTNTITNLSLANNIVGDVYNQTLTQTGLVGALTWSVSAGALPNGLTLNTTTGVISGTTTAIGAFTFTIEVRNDVCRDTKELSITVLPIPSVVIVTSSFVNGTTGTVYTQTLTQTGLTGTITWSVSAGTLPAGLTLNPTTGVISGTPTAGGTFNFTIQVTNGTFSQNKDYTLVIELNTTTATDNLLANSIKILPNPSSSDFNIDFGRINITKSVVSVYDIQGKRIFSSNVDSNSMTISLDKFANGIYLLEVKTSEGRITKRLAKQ